MNRNKRGLILDLGQADVVVENFAARVMQNFGLHYPVLQGVKPDLIMLSMSAYGCTGPYSSYGGIGGTAKPMSGISMQETSIAVKGGTFLVRRYSHPGQSLIILNCRHVGSLPCYSMAMPRWKSRTPVLQLTANSVRCAPAVGSS